MKKILLLITIAFVGMNGFAQVPTNFLVYRQDFNGNYTDTSSFGPAISNINTASLTTDAFNNSSAAGNFNLGETIEYPFSSNSQLMAGPTQMSISVKVNFDSVWLNGLANNQYVTFLKLGETYMRLLKTGGSYFLQCGVFNNNPTSGSFGYLGVSGYVADISNGWNTITMTYGPELPPNIGGALRVYYNGEYMGNAMRAVITPDNQPTAYNSATEKLILGKTISSNNNFKGKIDKVLIYSVRLTPAEVLAIQTEQPFISNLTTTNVSSTSKTVSYNLNANGSSTTSIIRYGTSPTTLTNSVTGGTATGTNTTPINITLTGLTAATRYYFQVEATNSSGTTLSNIYDEVPSSNVVKFPFNNNLVSSDGLKTLTVYSGSTPTFVENRFGEVNKAVYINNQILTSTISGLPLLRNSRSVSFWIKRVSDITHTIFSWGNASTSSAYGAYVTNGGSAANFVNFTWGSGNDYFGSAPYTTNWDHYVLVYKNESPSSGTVTTYKNGTQIFTTSSSLNTGGNETLLIGAYPNGTGNTSNMYLDDFTIFDTALTATEALAVYNSESTLTNQEFNSQNLKATIYPNPTSDNFSIEMENEVKLVEIYSLQGQKVVTSTSKDINVSTLSRGMYLVRIEDSNNAIATQKLIIK